MFYKTSNKKLAVFKKISHLAINNIKSKKHEKTTFKKNKNFKN